MGTKKMSGRARLPPGEPCKASQRNTRRAGPKQIRMAPGWRRVIPYAGKIALASTAATS